MYPRARRLPCRRRTLGTCRRTLLLRVPRRGRRPPPHPLFKEKSHTLWPSNLTSCPCWRVSAMQSRIPICRICNCPGQCPLTTSPVRLPWPQSVRFATSKRTRRPVRCVSQRTKLQGATTRRHGVGRRAQVSYLPAQPYMRSSLVSCFILRSVRLLSMFSRIVGRCRGCYTGGLRH